MRSTFDRSRYLVTNLYFAKIGNLFPDEIADACFRDCDYFKKQFSIISYRKVFAGDYVISVRFIPRLTLNFAGGIINYCGLRPTDLPSFEVAKLSGTNKNFAGSSLIPLPGFPKSRRM